MLREIGGWQNCVGEDIVLTWQLLSKGYETNFSKNAIAFTEVPEKLGSLGKQRRGWARGMIEAFKKVKTITSKELNFKSKFLMCLNIFFPFIDLALIIFVPLGLILLVLGKPLLIGWISLLVIPFGMLLCLLIEIRRKNMLKEIDCKLEKKKYISIYCLCFSICFYFSSLLFNWIYFRINKREERMVSIIENPNSLSKLLGFL